MILAFENSESLATAYGISVTGAMVVTTMMAFQFLRSSWGFSTLAATAVILPLFVIESVFLAANLLKIHDGGWVPVALALVIIVVMWTWTKGAKYLRELVANKDIPLDKFITSIEKEGSHAPVTVSGTAVFLTSAPDQVPSVLLHNLKHNQVLHEQNVVLTVKTADKPYVPESERIEIRRLSKRFMRIDIKFGFMEEPDVTRALALGEQSGFKFDVMKTSFYLGRRNLISTPNTGLPTWQEKLFITLAGAAIDPSAYFKLPPNRVVEVGEQVVI